ncbi:zinc finger c-x8-C-x5-C-x3-H type (and similar) domain-containing protein [Ditylenchus destructor]|nr:zinc finger c-x8-C-x5-C-x3-H type (and similar) domain-containing protein [Ditylenchus destructor]
MIDSHLIRPLLCHLARRLISRQYINPAANEKAAKAIRAHYGQVPADKYKTVMCQTCFESSMAANRKYKTRVCDKFVNQGICPYGERCLFIHPDVPYLQPTDFTVIDNCQIPFSTSAVGFSRSMYSVQWSTATNTQLDMPSYVPVMLPTAASCSSLFLL